MSSPEERAVEATNALSRVDNHLHGGGETLLDGRPNPDYEPANTNNTPSQSVNDRLTRIARQPLDSITPSNKKGVIEPAKKITKEKVGLDDLTKKGLALDEKKKAIEKDEQRGKPLSKDKNKDKDKDKEKDKKQTPEQEATRNQEEKMKAAFSKIQLPSGMEVHQEASKWVLVGKNNGARIDITDCMNEIDDFNRNVDAAQRGVDGAKDLTKDADANSQRRDGEEDTVSQWLQNDVKTPDGQPLLNEADAKALAQAAFSDEGILLDKLKDKEKENNNKDDKLMAFMQNRQQTR